MLALLFIRKLTAVWSSLEAKSLATRHRLNDERTLGCIEDLPRICNGPSIDLLVRLDDEVYLACGESSGPVKDVEKDTKVLVESGLKAPKAAQDMLCYLNRYVTYEALTTKHLQVMVVVTAGKQHTSCGRAFLLIFFKRLNNTTTEHGCRGWVHLAAVSGEIAAVSETDDRLQESVTYCETSHPDQGKWQE